MNRCLTAIALLFLALLLALPAQARFIQPDSARPEPRPASGTNRYAYSFNDPVNLSDPGEMRFAAVYALARRWGRLSRAS